MSRSRSRSRDYRSSRRRSRSKERSRDHERRRHKHRREKERRRSRSRTRSPPSRPADSPVYTDAMNNLVFDSSDAGTSGLALNGTTLPDDVKKDLCVRDWDPNKMTGAALRWISAQVSEQINQRNEELDNVVRQRVLTAKIEMEQRLRDQIEQEWKEEIDLTKKREQESLNRCKAMEVTLANKIKEVEEEKNKLNDERLSMLEVKSKLEMERNELREELNKLKKNEQTTILNKGGFQRAPIRMSFGTK